jgi:hypothetical protein
MAKTGHQPDDDSLAGVLGRVLHCGSAGPGGLMLARSSACAADAKPRWHVGTKARLGKKSVVSESALFRICNIKL